MKQSHDSQTASDPHFGRSKPAAGAPEPVVLSVGFPFAIVGPGAVGGAEVVLSEIEKALPSLGFRSVVVAREGSAPVGQLYATPVPSGEIDEAVRTQVEAAQQANVDLALAEHHVSLVHMHGLDFHRYRFPPDIPILVTLHLPPGWYPEVIWRLPANYHLTCVSETQKAACPAYALERIEVIGNGIPLPDRVSLRPEGKYALMLSRICPEKNLHTGFDAARIAGIPAMLAGEVFPYRDHLRYFAEGIEPRLTTPSQEHTARSRDQHPAADARFLGPITGVAKARLLSRAACLLLPSLAPETSSLVAMEALAAGVPVVAVASGAVPEIVEHGRTGLLVSSTGDIASDLASALRQLPSLDRALCRETAEARFSVQAMLQAYATLYRRLARTVPAPIPPPELEPSSVECKPAEMTAGPHGKPQTTLLVGTDALTSLQTAWAELWRADPTATPFQHPAWLLPWARQFGPDGLVQTVEQRDEHGHLLGLLPLFGYREPSEGTQKLLLLGTGTTDYLGGIFRAPSAVFLAAQALQFALTVIPAWNRLDLLQLHSDSPLLPAAANIPGLHTAAAEPCAVLPSSAALPAKIVANIRRYQHRAESQGRIDFTVASDVAEAEVYFSRLVELHGKRWQARQESGVLDDPRVLGHHREAIPALMAAGLLRLFRLRCGEDTVAVLYALADPVERCVRRLYLYLIGIDIRRSDISPGTLILHEVWRYARQQGFAELDMLRGGERYKALWGATAARTYALHAAK